MLQRSSSIEADLARVGVHVSTTRKSLVRWKTTDGRSGPKPPSDSEIYDMVRAFEQGCFSGSESSDYQQMMAEMTVSGVVVGHFDHSGRPCARGALRWFSIDHRTGPAKMSEREWESTDLPGFAPARFRSSSPLHDDAAALRERSAADARAEADLEG